MNNKCRLVSRLSLLNINQMSNKYYCWNSNAHLERKPKESILNGKCATFLHASVPLTADNLSEQFLRRVAEERSTANQKLVQDDSHSPPVHWFPITLPEYHLWGNIFRCTTYLEGKQDAVQVREQP